MKKILLIILLILLLTGCNNNKIDKDEVKRIENIINN